MAQHVTRPDMRAHLEVWIDRLATVDPFDAASIEASLRALAAERGIKAASLIHATRVAVTGQTVSPGIFDVIVVAGRERVIRRLADALGSSA
jgi:glutamyl-tRNA synthetase